LSGKAPEVAIWLARRSERVIETSCAWVFLRGDTALKIKRPVHFGFLDFTTLEKRGWALERELAFNRLTAPDVYRAVHRITRTVDAGLELDGKGTLVDYALEMRRFDENAVLSANPNLIDAAMAETLGREIAGFHAKAELRPNVGVKSLAYVIGSNASLLRELAEVFSAEKVEALVAATDTAFTAQQDLLERRAAAGFMRRCHGDLHLGNIFLEHGKPVLFDCIEFNDLLSEIDVQYDLAFILMDLDIRKRRDAGVRLLGAYLDEAARTFGEAVFEGLAALPLMLSIRAAVRAHVTAHAGDHPTARAYLEAAMAHLSPPPARLVALGGFSGSGKSTVARLVAPAIGASPGALILRTDEVRKRVMGVGPTEPLPPAAYAPELYAQVYDALFATAATALRAGRTVILDATFIAPDLRGRAQQTARSARVRFEGRWLQAPPEVLRERLAGRTGDASDATVLTLETQLSRPEQPIEWPAVDASGEPAAVAARLKLA
jgi:aminoglycoside phosphotransferase family enzyme/predicted kinase